MTKKITLSIIVAMARNRVIGLDNDMPWHIPEDLKRFKVLTMGKPVIMGRKTFESIFKRLGKPLPGRTNIVISRNMTAQFPGYTLCGTLDSALDVARSEARARGLNEIFVIGGAQIYGLALPKADRIYLTEIDAAPGGDAFFPEIDPKIWQTATSEVHEGFVFRDIVRKDKPSRTFSEIA
ncbi:MAG: dihydrofolate reductase [Rhodospirillales bacterium]|nr:dihydrofolate reductase [Rhodospirillales bacterium]